MRVTVFSMALLFCSATLAQQAPTIASPQLVDDMPMNTFRFGGNTIICKMQNPDDQDACLRIGDFKMGDDFAALASKMGKPYRIIPQSDERTAVVYVITATQESEAYWVLEHHDGKLVAIQLTGDAPVPDVSFSTIQLTDPEAKVKEVLGPRYAISEVPEIGGTLWDYDPFPFSIEFVDGKVYSIRISR